MAEKQQKKKKGRSVQELLGIRTFTKYGLAVGKYELLFYLVAPTNISVLSHTNIEIKIRHLMMVLSAIPDDPKVRKIIKRDIDHLDHIQMEMATARQFLFMARLKNTKDKQIFDAANRIEKTISEQGFEVHRMKRPEIKRFLALYFEASMNGDAMPDADGEQFYEVDADDEEDRT